MTKADQDELQACPYPSYDVDFYADEVIKDQLRHFKAMRDLGPVVWLPRHGNFAITRHAELTQALLNWEVFSSANGIAADDFGCEFARAGSIMNDPPVHTELRRVSSAPLRPSALETDRPDIKKEAVALIDTLVKRDSFDGIVDFARHLPLTLVRDFVGLPEEGQENMLAFATAGFDVMGCQNARGQAGIKTLEALIPSMQMGLSPEVLKPGSWALQLFGRAAAGEIPPEWVPQLLPDYLGPSLDTTISVTGQLIYHLGKNPDQWEMLKEDPSLIPNAVLEGVRLASPIRSFTRTVTEDFELGGVILPKGARVMMLYSCANRDERKFHNPDVLDVTRDTSGHLGFGTGIHICAGQHLAKMEIEALLQAMVTRVDTIEVSEPTLALNNTIYGFASLPVTFTKAKTTGRSTPAVVQDGWIDVNVAERADAADDVVAIELQASDGGVLPAFEAGAHVDINLGNGLTRQYSLCSQPSKTPRSYRIAILREPNSRGGSEWVHSDLGAGTHFQISEPRNLFKLTKSSTPVLLLAGGIGITPLLAMAYELKESGRDFQLHYTARSLSRAAFADELTTEFGDSVTLYADNEVGAARFDLDQVLAQAQPAQHIYCCGPGGFIDHVMKQAANAGWDEARLHFERFTGDEIDTSGSFTVLAQKSGVEVDVPEGTTVLQALLDAGVTVPYSCEAGVCGTCRCNVLEGEPDHRDKIQSDTQKASNKRMMVCCSRAKSDRLVLDI